MKKHSTTYRKSLYGQYFNADGSLKAEIVPQDIQHVENELILASACDMLTDDLKKTRRISAVLCGAVTVSAAAAVIFARCGHGQ